jgi:hypothetical protein
MGIIIKVIEKETSGKSFNSKKYCHDTEDKSGIMKIIKMWNGKIMEKLKN